MTDRRKYAAADLDVRSAIRQVEEDGVTTHTHVVIFARPLLPAERDLFSRMVVGFYYAVHFSGLFGNNLVTEPTIEFPEPARARYTLRQRGVSGPWKDLLFAMLANFSRNIVAILRHDDSRAFDPAHQLALREGVSDRSPSV
ncbi:MAG: hypothetical protein HY023_09335 [Chloroflexi bacterium]|nr:hypothetical protein [Chloroflexota bacterium]MBI3762902.1 hypothetical protein [Chloroflexota bacterium]